MSQKDARNVRQFYRQQVLSGYGDIIQPKIETGDSSQNEQRGEEEIPPEFWQQKEYQISISVIIETISSDSNEHKYQIYVNDDTDIFISPTSKRGKKMSQQVATIHKENVSKNRKIPMVYGIQPPGFRSLSYPVGFSIGQGIAGFYSFLLGQIDRTIEHIIQQQENQKGNDDAGECDKGSQSSEDVGTNKKTGRGGKVLPKIRNENKPKATAVMDESDGALLGRRPRDVSDKLVGLGNIVHLGDET